MRNTILGLNPNAYWRLGETSGISAVDESGNGYTGTYEGTPLPTVGVTGLTRDDTDKAVHFDASVGDARLDIGTSIGNVGIRTIVATIKLDEEFSSSSTAYLPIIYRNEGTNNNNFGLRFNYVDGTLQFYRYIGTTPYFCTSDATVWSPNEIYHIVAIIHPSSGMRMYINNVKQASTESSTQAVGSETEITAIGAWGNYDGRPFGGTIDELALFDYNILESDVADLYRRSLGYTNSPTTFEEYAKYLIPESYWRFNDLELLSNSINDDFNGTDGDSVNLTLWRDLFGDPKITSNEFRFTEINDGVTSYQGMNSIYGLRGALVDLQIDYTFHATDQPSSYSGHRASLYIEGENNRALLYRQHSGDPSWPHVYKLHVYDNVGAEIEVTSYQTADISGKLRIKVETNSITFYVWNESLTQWEWDGNTSGSSYAYSMGDVTFIQPSIKHEKDASDISLDNFIVLDGDIIEQTHDETQHNKTGVYSEFVIYQQDGLIYGDPNNKAIGSDGVLDHYVMEGSGDEHLLLGINDFTFTFLLKCNAVSPNSIIIDGRLALGIFTIGVGATNKLKYTGSADVEGSTSIDDGGTYLCTVIRNSQNIELYVNGVLDGSGADTTDYDTELGGLWTLGTPNGNNVDGTLDELLIYNGALTVDEVSSLWNLTVPNALNFTIDHTTISEDLYDLPILINLDVDTGKGDYDTTQVFDVLADPLKLEAIYPSVNFDKPIYNVDDTFDGTNGDSPNIVLWESENGTIQNNKFNVDTGVVASDVIGRLKSVYKLSGNFDFQIDFSDIVSSGENSLFFYFEDIVSDSYFYLIRDFRSGQLDFRVLTAHIDHSNSTTVNIADATTDFKLRMTRIGGVVTSYYDNGSGWEWGGSSSGYTHTLFSTNDIQFEVQLKRYGSIDSGSLFVNVDNFKLSGNFYFPIYGDLAKTHHNCKLEIDRWDDVNKQAQLWVKVPYISSQNDTIINLGYASYNEINSSNTGYTGSTPAQDVWTNYGAVYHLSSDAGESTVNVLDGTLINMDGSNIVDFGIGKGLLFNGSDEYIDLTQFNYSVGSISVTAKWQSLGDAENYLFTQDGAGHILGDFNLYSTSAGDLRFYIDDGVSASGPSTGDGAVLIDTQYTVDCTWDGTTRKLYVDGVLIDTSTDSHGLINTSADAELSARSRSSAYTENHLKNVMFSDNVKDVNWIETNYENISDTLLNVVHTYTSPIVTQPDYELNTRAFYRMDENAGSILYDEINNYDGTIHGTVEYEQIKLDQSLVSGTSLEFTLSGNSYATIPNQNDLKGFSCTVVFPIMDNWLTIFQQYISSVDRFTLITDGNAQKLILVFGSSSTILLESDNNLNAGQTYHIAYKYEPTLLESSLWIDGVKQTLISATNVFQNNSTTTYIGTNENTGGDEVANINNNKIIDDVYLFESLTDDDIQILYENSSGINVLNIDIIESGSSVDVNLTPEATLDIRAFYKCDDEIGSMVLLDDMGLYDGTIITGADFKQAQIDETYLSAHSVLFQNSGFASLPAQNGLQGYSCSTITPAVFDTYHWYFTQGIDTDNRVHLYYHDASGLLNVWLDNSLIIVSDSILTINTKYHFVLWYDSTANETSLWINGVKQTQTHIGNAFTDNATGTYINEWLTAPSIHYSPLNIDDIYLFNSLTLTDIEFLNEYSLQEMNKIYVGESVNVQLKIEGQFDIARYYKCDDLNSSSVLIDSANGINGTIYGTPLYELDPLSLSEFGGKSMFFGQYDRAEIPNANNIEGFACTVMTPDLSIHSFLLSQNTTNSDRLILYINFNNNKVTLVVNSTTHITSDVDIIEDQIYNIALQYTTLSGETAMWIDGVKQTETYTGNAFRLDPVVTTLFNYYYNEIPNTGNYSGFYDDVYLFNTFSDADVESVYELSQGNLNYYSNVGEECSVDIEWNTKYNMSSHTINKGITIFSGYKDLTKGFDYGQRAIIQTGAFAIGGLPSSMHYRLIGNTLVNGVGTKCKVILYNKDMKQMGSFHSEDDGSFIAQSIHPHQYYHLVGLSLTGECPEITGLTSEIIKSSQDI